MKKRLKMRNAICVVIAVLIAHCALLITHCSSAQAADSRVEKAVQWACDIANDNTHGYSQGAENPPYTGSRDGLDYDCSSLVYHALDYAGFDIVNNWKKNPKYMSRYGGKQKVGDADTIWEDLQPLGGWVKYSWNDAKDNLQRGDILCNPHHVAFYIGDGKTVEARGVNNPRGGSYSTGDQGGEIDFYDAYGRGWTEVYRYIPNS